MKRKYSEDLLEAIKKNQTCETVDGVDVLIKPIPEGGEPGDMDPHLYKSMRIAGWMMRFMPKQKLEESKVKMSAQA